MKKAVVALLLLTACAVDPRASPAPTPRTVPPVPEPPAREAISPWETYRVSWAPIPDPIPVNESFDLRIEVSGGPAHDDPVTGARLAVRGWMPEHRHGMLRVPPVEERGDGVYLARGVLLHMPGRWELSIDVLNADRTSETVRFELDLQRDPGVFTDAETQRILELSPLPPPPPDPTNRVADDPAAARLGQFLFFDQRLSGPGNVSCATCHDPEEGFSDGRTLAVGQQELTRHSMTLWNVAYNRWFFWDGRADSLWSQALQPLEDVREHAGTRRQYAGLVRDDPTLRAAYEGVFGPLPERDDETATEVFVNLAKAIAAYERRLVSRHSDFDRFVEGLREDDATRQEVLSPEARQGLKLFLGRANCHVCHAGPEFTDREFHSNRVPPLRIGMEEDPGREGGVPLVRASPFRGDGEYSDDPTGEAALKVETLLSHPHGRGEFKTPTLRNVARTAPYMHQGQLATLEEVVRHYSTLETTGVRSRETILKPLHLTDQEVAALVAFLESLTDEDIDSVLLRPPASPHPAGAMSR